MTSHRIEIKNIRGLSELKVDFNFSARNIIVITGKNGVGKTTLAKAFKLLSDAQVYDKTSSLNSITPSSSILFNLDWHKLITFTYNPKVKRLDTKDALPPKKSIISELPIPYGERFQHFSLIAKYDSEVRANIASSNYQNAQDICDFLNKVYPDSTRFSKLKKTKIKNNEFYFILQSNDYYIREDHLSSGEFFLIQLYRLITSKAKLIIIDELDISLDASAQIHLIKAIEPLLDKYHSHLIVVSHSLAFMQTVNDGGLYYLEEQGSTILLEQRSFGYIKSDLYGFRGKDRYILTEDDALVGFLNFIIQFYQISTFFQYEIIAIGGQPQIESIAQKNDEHEIFSSPENVIIVIDGDIINKIKYNGKTKLHPSPVDDLELFIWNNRTRLLPDVNLEEFKYAKKEKDTAKTYWKKIINSNQKTRNQLYELVINENRKETDRLAETLKSHLCLRQ